MPLKTKYALGFAFCSDQCHVVLIRKNRPDWQAGKLNGVGGHAELGETREETMIREFEEETGVKITKWDKFARISGVHSDIDIFRAFDDSICEVDSLTDEVVNVYSVSDFLCGGWDYEIVPNLKFLIPMALTSNLYFSNLEYDV